MQIECFVCSRSIPHGEPHLSIDYNIEHTEEPSYITVERSDSLLTACIDCAPSRETVAEALRSAGLPVPPEA
jgi:hypothetical protein